MLLNEKITQKMKKNWLLLLLAGGCLLMVLLWGLGHWVNRPTSTPIARIEPKDSVKVYAPPSRLKAYQQEIEDNNPYHASRQKDIEQIIAMNFTESFEANSSAQAVAARTDTLPAAKPHKGADHLPKTASAPGMRRESTPKKAKRFSSSPDSLRGKSVKDDFYTIRAEANQQPQSAVDSLHFIPAVINGDQKLSNGSSVSLRLKETATIHQMTVPKNTLLHGTVSNGGNDRLRITITRIKNAPVQLSVFDQDYAEGIAYQTKNPVDQAVAEGKNEALEEVFGSLPYGGVLGGITRLGKNITRRTRQGSSFYLADGYRVWIAADQ